jgi:predicted PhzF superfamily epimerase YddE/YHI9
MFFFYFPTDKLDVLSVEQSAKIEKCTGVKPIKCYRGRTDCLAVIDNESTLQLLKPDFGEIAKLEARGLIVTAKGDETDFVSRFFAPQSGIDEDPVTGSAHTSLIPLWSKKLNKKILMAKQLSKRGGQLVCEFKGDRCLIGGKARLYLTGEINIDN